MGDGRGTVVGPLAKLLSIGALSIALVALAGYLVHAPLLYTVRTGLKGMSPLTALALVLLASAQLARTRGLLGAVRAFGFGAALIGAIVLVGHAVAGDDDLSPWLSRAVFGSGVAAGRTSIGTALSVLFLGLAELPLLRGRSRLGDAAAGLAVLLSSLALLGYAYGVQDLYALRLFHTMALNTAVTIFALGVASILSHAEGGWAKAITLSGPAGHTTRRQLIFTLIPPIIGYVLVAAATRGALGLGAAMALFVVLTVAPLLWLILRDGRALAELDAERERRQALEKEHLQVLEGRLAAQAAELEHSNSARLELAEQASLRSENRYRLLFDSIDAGFCVIEMLFGPDGAPRDYRFLEVNAAFGQNTGLADAEGRLMRDLAPDHEQHWFDTYGAVATTGEAIRFELPAEALGGRWYDVHAFPVDDPQLKRIGILFNDVTSQKRAQLELESVNANLEQRVADALAERRVFADIIESTDDAVLACDPDLTILAINAATIRQIDRIYGVGLKVGDNLLDALEALPEHRTQVERHWRRALSGEEFVFTDEFGDPDRDRVFFEVRFFPLSDRDGKRIGAFQTAYDVSDRVRAAAELQAAQDALRQAQKMEAVGQLTGGLAHDFNNLLTGIMGNLELLQVRVARGRLDDLDRFINAAQGAGRRAASLTQRLLAFSRRQTLDPKATDVNRLVAGLEELLRRTVGPLHNIEVVQAAGLWSAMIDATQLESAVLNLAINARDAMPDGGRLTIETANKWLDDRAARERDLPPGQYLSICVSDTGTGMTAEVAARAFDPFYTTKPIGEGTGLGLSMIYGFARQSGGQVRIYSELGQGTTVCIYLPRHLGEAEEAIDSTTDVSPTGGKGETVLVVDDEATIRHLIDEVLDDRGYTVIGAADGAAGLKVLQSDVRIDLLITDVGLPGGLNGRQVADAARALRRGLKVLFITGYVENAAVGNGHMELGMELLTKPFAMADLASKVQDILADPGAPAVPPTAPASQ